MSSVPHLASVTPLLRTIRFVLMSGLLASALTGCAIWPKALTWGPHDTPAPPPSAQVAAPPPVAAAVVEEIPNLEPLPVPASTADTAPIEARPGVIATPVPPPPTHAAAKSAPKGKGKKRDKAAAHPPAHKAGSGDLVPGFYINVGLFAVPTNGTNAFRTLEKAELPVFTDVVKSKKGPLTRVRVGPYLSKAVADAAAEKIKEMKLEAVVFQH
ncbi:MAG: SPOR domain-containing protein [Rhodoferax sp.]|nr:SPOR domain-containing protein [Rhodoferax sp.]